MLNVSVRKRVKVTFNTVTEASEGMRMLQISNTNGQKIKKLKEKI